VRDDLPFLVLLVPAHHPAFGDFRRRRPSRGLEVNHGGLGIEGQEKFRRGTRTNVREDETKSK